MCSLRDASWEEDPGADGRRLWGSCPLVTEGQEAEGMLYPFWQAVCRHWLISVQGP